MNDMGCIRVCNKTLSWIWSQSRNQVKDSVIVINCNLLHPAMSHVTKPAAIHAQAVLVDNDSTATRINLCMGLP